MAGSATHQWQGRPLISLERPELLEVASLLARLLEEATGERPSLTLILDRLPTPDLIRLVWRLDVRLEPLRPMNPGSPKARASGIPSGSTSSKSAAPSGTAAGTPSSGFGDAAGLPGVL